MSDERMELQVTASPPKHYDLDQVIFDLDSQIDLLQSHADSLDYVVAVGSGVLCALLDILWTGEFSLERGRKLASGQIDRFVLWSAKLTGYKGGDLSDAVKHLEKFFPLSSDGNTSDFGGGKQHHLRDFAHHPTVVGLVFSLLTQFTGYSYGTDRNGLFKAVPVAEKSQKYLGSDLPSKLFLGTVTWFFHLVSDMAGSSSTAGLSGGTGIPGPLLSLAKELSSLPVFHSDDASAPSAASVLLSKFFNGTISVQRGAQGHIIPDTVVPLDLRGELGVALELGRQALPVIANECLVRCFYFLRAFGRKLKERHISRAEALDNFPWKDCLAGPTLNRMLTVATGVFTGLDLSEAIISGKIWVSVNYVGVGRFSVAIGLEMAQSLQKRNLHQLRDMYDTIRKNIYTHSDTRIYERIGTFMDLARFGLTPAQTELLYNLEYHMVMHDIACTNFPVGAEEAKALKRQWLTEWRDYITKGYPDFIQRKDAKIHWYTEDRLLEKIHEASPERTWFRLMLLEALLFEPYFPLSEDKDKAGKSKPSTKYRSLQSNPTRKFNKSAGDDYLDSLFPESYYQKGYVHRLRKSYNKACRTLNEVVKTALTTVAVTAGVIILSIATVGALFPSIAVALVGSNFAGLHGAALTGACLAYLGGGAVAAGGAGMAGGTMAIVGGGALLSTGISSAIGSTVSAVRLLGKKNTIALSAKLMVSVREVFLNDEHDTVFANSVYEAYVQKSIEIEKTLARLNYEASIADKEHKKAIEEEIKITKETVATMKLARDDMRKFISSFEEGESLEEDDLAEESGADSGKGEKNQ